MVYTTLINMVDKLPRFLSTNLYYLEELRVCLVRSIVVFIIAFIAGFAYCGPIVRFALSKLQLEQVSIVVTSPFQFLNLASDIGILSGLLITLPYIFIQFLFFVRPALSKHEFRLFFFLIPGACALFALGAAYGFITLYYGLQLIADLNVSFGLQNLWDISLFMAEIMITSLLLGACFEFPILLVIANKVGLISKTILTKHRRTAYASIFILISLLPPTDGVSLIVMSLPLVLLYEISVSLTS